MQFDLILVSLTSLMINIDAELIHWNYKLKHFVQLKSRFERECVTKTPLESNHTISWLLYPYNGHPSIVNRSTLDIPVFEIEDEGIAICQVKDSTGVILDEKYFFLTNDPTDLIDHRFEGYEQSLIDTNMTKQERHCGPDENIEYHPNDIVDFHIDFVQHFERVRLHFNHIHIQNVKHEHEGYYECTVRLKNGLVGVRVFFLSVGGGPRHISLRERHVYAEPHDKMAILCPIFSAVPAWYSFITPNGKAHDLSDLTGYDFLRLYNVSREQAGNYTCRVATSEGDDGYSLSARVHLHVLDVPEYAPPHLHEDVSLMIEKQASHPIHCSIEGDPHPHYRWFRRDVALNEKINEHEVISQGREYLFTPDTNDPPGSNYTLTCIATNNRGSKRQVFHLRLKD